MKDIDYTNYTLEELEETLAHIDAQAHPKRHKTLLEEFEQRIKTLNPFAQHKKAGAFIDDPVAKITHWEPLNSGGANFKTHRLVLVNSSKIIFRPSIFALLFYIIFIIVGASVFIKGVNELPLSYQQINQDSFIFMGVGALFLIVGVYLLYTGTRAIVFDKIRGYYWKGKPPSKHLRLNTYHPNIASLKSIHAIQLVSESIQKENSSYYSYELNLVLKSGDRLNVIDHGNYEKIQSNARQLASFLHKPVWDAI
ncbi:MAG TPA: hypothetical protein ENJ60_14865 [Aeromonadales bacterium]|nr:hypothetical protein [Aeromonadales bacterium]